MRWYLTLLDINKVLRPHEACCPAIIRCAPPPWDRSNPRGLPESTAAIMLVITSTEPGSQQQKRIPGNLPSGNPSSVTSSLRVLQRRADRSCRYRQCTSTSRPPASSRSRRVCRYHGPAVRLLDPGSRVSTFRKDIRVRRISRPRLWRPSRTRSFLAAVADHCSSRAWIAAASAARLSPVADGTHDMARRRTGSARAKAQFAFSSSPVRLLVPIGGDTRPHRNAPGRKQSGRRFRYAIVQSR